MFVGRTLHYKWISLGMTKRLYFQIYIQVGPFYGIAS